MSKKPILTALKKEVPETVPFWFMRQAGRYLPEYRNLRQKAGSFLAMAYNPDLACEITMQPIRRYGMDAAILFSDILVIPHALGVDLDFVEGEGPKLDPVTPENLARLELHQIDETLAPIYEAISKICSALSEEKFNQTGLIGFAGSPWTVACYMVEGSGSKDFMCTRQWAKNDQESFEKLIAILTQATTHYLSKQIEAGVEVVQLFDSWAGLIDGEDFSKWVIEPTKTIVQNLKQTYPHVPIIGFPRQANNNYIPYTQQIEIDAVGLDQNISPSWANDNLRSDIVIQGNLDPELLLGSDDDLEREVKNILHIFSSRPFIFNLGHGVQKQTDPDKVQKLVEIIRSYQR